MASFPSVLFQNCGRLQGKQVLNNFRRCFLHSNLFPVLLHTYSNSRLLTSTYPCIGLCRSFWNSHVYFGDVPIIRRNFCTIKKSKTVFNDFPHSCCKRIQNQNFSSDGKQMEYVQQLVDNILKATREVDVMADSLPRSSIADLVHYLQGQGFGGKLIEKFLSRRLWLLQEPNSTINLSQTLLLHDFPPHLVCKLIHAVPYSFQNSLGVLPDRVNSVILLFRNQAISGKAMKYLFDTEPSVLFSDIESIKKSYARLKSIFTDKEVQKLLKRCPGILCDSWPEIQRKYEYALFKMVYTNEAMINCFYFSHPFDHIKNRHLILVRSGLFATVSHKLDPALNPNPTLSSLVDTSDLTFLKLFPVASLEEYYIFCQMRAVEMEMEEEDLDALSDDDTGSDEEIVEVETRVQKNKNKSAKSKRKWR